MKDNVHENHRERMRDRFIQNGVDSMPPHEVLEVLLYYVMPRCDTNPIAHELIDTFGSFSGVLEASVEDLAAVKGIGKRTAVFLKLFLDVNRFYEVDKTANIKHFSTIEEVGEFLKPRFIGRRNEIVFMISLDSKNDIIAAQILFEGDVNSATLNIRQMIGTAIRLNAASVVIAHNHPGGVAVPSSKDMETTEYLFAIFKSLNIRLLDHFVFAGKDFTSIRQSRESYRRYDNKKRVYTFNSETADFEDFFGSFDPFLKD